MDSGTKLVPRLAFITAWEWEGHGHPPAVIGTNENWMSTDTKRNFEGKVLDVLTDLGLAANGTLTHEFRDTIALLATGGRRFTGWTSDIESDETGAILVALSGDEAARLLRDKDLVRIEPVPAEYAAEALVDAIPSLPPAVLDPIAIPKSAYSPNGGGQGEGFDFVMPTSFGTGDPTARPRALMAAKRMGIHQLYAANTDGGRSAPITVIDVVGEGRVLTYLASGANNEAHINFLPGTRQNIVGTLYNS